MPMNQIQFQRGLPLPQFLAEYGPDPIASVAAVADNPELTSVFGNQPCVQ